MKALLIIAIVLGLPVVVFLARKRVWLALKVAAAMLIAVNIFRFARATQSDDAAAKFLTLALALGAFGLVWLALWLVTRFVERQRALHPPAPRAPQQRQRWRL
jgi:hypothetical protein